MVACDVSTIISSSPAAAISGERAIAIELRNPFSIVAGSPGLCRYRSSMAREGLRRANEMASFSIISAVLPIVD
jgi:hypothetical protein